MEFSSFLGSGIFTWVVLPILIFLARISDVSIGTIRLIAIAKGMRRLAPLLGFFEVLIWLLAIGQIMQHLTNALCYIAYAGGFATGNYIGMLLENKLALGTVIVRIITRKDTTALVEALRSENYGVTVTDAEGHHWMMKILIVPVARQNLPHIYSLIRQHNPNAFYSVEDVRLMQEGEMPLRKRSTARNPLFLLRPFARER